MENVVLASASLEQVWRKPMLHLVSTRALGSRAFEYHRNWLT